MRNNNESGRNGTGSTASAKRAKPSVPPARKDEAAAQPAPPGDAHRALRENEERFRSLTELSSDWYWEQDEQYRFTYVAGRHVGPDELIHPERMLGKPRWETGIQLLEGSWEAHLTQLDARKPFYDLEFHREGRDGEEVFLSSSGRPVFDEAGVFKGYRGVGREITARKLAERLLKLEHTVAGRINEAETLSTGLTAALQAVCETEHWESGRYFQPGTASGLLGLAAFWTAAGAPFEDFVARSRQVSYAPGDGLIGRVWQSAEAIWAADLSKDERSLDKAGAQAAGLRGAFVIPVMSEGQSIGVISFNSRRVREPEERLLQAVRVIGSQIGSFVRRKQAEDVLRESEERFRSLIELSSDWYWEQDEEFRFTMVTDKLHRRMKRPAAAVLGKRRWEIPTPNMSEPDWEAHRGRLHDHEPFYDLELLRLDTEGKPHYGSISGKPVFDVHGRFKGYRGIGIDITERRRMEQALRENEARYRSVVDNLAEGVVIVDPQGRVVSSNPSAERIIGATKSQLAGAPLADPAIPSVREDGSALPEQERPSMVTLRTGQPQSNVVMGLPQPDGSVTWLTINTRPLFGADGKTLRGVVVSFSNITERRQFEEKLTYLAQNDTLTGLPNRVLLQDRLSQALARARRHATLVGVLLIDFDRFKEINDSLGHSAGDSVLKEAAKRLRTVLRNTDSVARLGGDEFCIVIEDCDSRESIAVAAVKLQHLFNEPMVTSENREIFIELSIGCSLFPDDGESIDDLLKNADIAMYEAKREGGNAFRFYSSALQAKTTDEINMAAMLRRAIDRNELVLHYQPQVDIATGLPLGVEALVRWQHPDLGLIGPHRFVRIAEETGLIVPIGEWVLKTACAEVKAWQQAGMPNLGVSVNLSARQFRDPQLIRKIAGVLGATGLSPKFLELEITEGVIMSHTDHTIGLLHRLVDLGVHIAIDDFGTGYSSLAYLKRFPVTRLKIDRAFVRDIHTDKDDAAIVQAIVTLARTLGLGVIAEGVQTADQLTYLASLGCREYQGYYYSRPLPADELVDLLRAKYKQTF
jgi:diguanylate cyclase (GGDEF)-like protein/PAS domain S-box-containing protein